MTVIYQISSLYAYHGDDCELLTITKSFGKEIADIRLLVSGERKRVPLTELTEAHTKNSAERIAFLATAAKIKSELSQHSLIAPYESNIIPLPHQILALEKVMSGQHLRFLLADEVGMGKTIEAGLVLKELKLRGIAKRTLIITPVSATMQWKNELKKHFNEDFYLYDTSLINSLYTTFSQLEADNPVNIWRQHNQIIIPIDALKPLESRRGWSAEKVEAYNRFRIQSVIDADFDLLVIDECHKVGGSSTLVGRYKMAEMLSSAIPNILLLSATPHRGKSDHFRRILQLLDADAFAGDGMPTIKELDPFVVRTEKRHALNYDGRKLFNKRNTEKRQVVYDALRHFRQQSLYEAVTRYVVEGFNQSVQSKNTSYGFVMVLFQRMMSSSTQAILQAMEKRAQRLSAEEQNVTEESIKAELEEIVGEGGQLMMDFEEKVSHVLENVKAGYQSELEILRGLIQQARECQEMELDAKADYLLAILRSLKQKEGNPKLKFLIFTEFTATQAMLKKVLSENGGFVCETINGSMDLSQRVEALKKFKEEAQILVSTDAAGESLNMQFAHIIINYDMPWNPMVVEQRIGRVDRIGQEKEVLALNLMLDNSIDERVYEVIEEKLDKIIAELGIDKTADVLDSTLESKKIQDLYLTSLLNPAQFEQKSQEWLEDIKLKLKDYQSTEGALPSTQSGLITVEKSDAVKQSPLPVLLETLTKTYLSEQGIPYQSLLNGHLKFKFPNRSEQVYTFDVKESLANPVPEPLSIQHEIVQQMLREAVPHYREEPISVLKQGNVKGFWSLWRLKVANSLEIREVTMPMFINDENKAYPVFAEDFWHQILKTPQRDIAHELPVNESVTIFNLMETKAEEMMQTAFEKIENDIKSNLKRVADNRLKAFGFQKKQLLKIGIDNIKQSRLLRLEKEIEKWNRDFESAFDIIPELECLLLIRLEA